MVEYMVEISKESKVHSGKASIFWLISHGMTRQATDAVHHHAQDRQHIHSHAHDKAIDTIHCHTVMPMTVNRCSLPSCLWQATDTVHHYACDKQQIHHHAPDKNRYTVMPLTSNRYTVMPLTSNRYTVMLMTSNIYHSPTCSWQAISCF